ncbi:hypothetical protein SAMN05216184_11272 [Georgenia satyanarayanai]|uniref:Uncharacterized protein n=1 Tax=Georgenia satyanarayanai TaxID=860221 RepID=A0A2Y9C7D5_9MICO|nr:hypothetical protein A8987_11272 [Georgenia satyanarayanai]SSA45213.1 hypothetical protein SAMN05216184_11272 [Georgenia satyanarayanai]
MIRRWLATLGVLALVTTALVGIAHASQLALAPPTTASLDVVRKCAQADVQVIGAVGRTQLTVSGLPAACGGLPMRLWLHEAGTTRHVDAVTPHEGGALTVTLPAPVGARPTAVVTVRTWPMPTTARISDFPTFTCRTPDAPQVGCAVSVSKRTNWPDYWQRTLLISTTSTTPVRWELTVDLSTSAFMTTKELLDIRTSLTRTSALDCARTPRTVTIGGRPMHNNFHLVDSTTVREAELQGNPTVNIYANPNSVLLHCP